MDKEQLEIIRKYVDIALRRKTIIIFCFFLGIAIGLGQYLQKPKIYQCSALLKYQRQQVNPTAMSPDDLRTRTEDVVDTVSQQIMSRSSLEQLIKKHDLYGQMRKAVPMESVVEMMRENHIRTDLLEGGDVFRVSYQGKDQDKVMKVTNDLAAKFIEENLKFRQERASQTSTYISDELEIAEEALNTKEKIMRDYRLQHYNEMPEQLDNNTNRLNALQDQYQNNQASILELERTRLLIQEQISQRKHLLAQIAAGSLAGNELEEQEELTTSQQIRLRLKNLRTRYKEKHPEIKRLKKMLQDLESEEGQIPASVAGDTDTTTTVELDPQIQELSQQLKDVQLNLKNLKEERQVLDKQIKKYEKWITATPVREAEWASLTRDYEQLNEHYEELVARSLEAKSAQTLENQLKGSQFQIVDSAHFPEKPIQPDFKKIMIMAIGLGLGLGSAIALSLEIFNTSFTTPSELEKYLELPVVASIPLLPTKRELVIRRLKTITVNIFLLLVGAIILGATAYFWKQGMIVL